MAAVIIRAAFFALVVAAMAGPGAHTLWRIASGHEVARSASENRLLRRVADTSIEQATIADGAIALRYHVAGALVDQLTPREFATRTWNRVLVYGFRQSTNERIVLGEQGFWFAAGTETDPFRLVDCPSFRTVSDADLKSIGSNLAYADALLNERGIEHFTIFAPTSSHAFSEYLPRDWRRVCGFGGGARVIDRLLVQIAETPNMRVSYPIELMRELGPDGVSHRRSFHWHGYGAARLFDEAFVELGEPSAFRGRTDGVRTPRSPTDNARALGVAPNDHEEPIPHFQYTVQRDRTEPDPLDPFMVRPGMVMRVRSNNRNGRRALLIGDSFGYASVAYLAQRFERVAFISTTRLEAGAGILTDLVETENPTDVIFVFSEPKAWAPDYFASILSPPKFNALSTVEP